MLVLSPSLDSFSPCSAVPISLLLFLSQRGWQLRHLEKRSSYTEHIAPFLCLRSCFLLQRGSAWCQAPSPMWDIQPKPLPGNISRDSSVGLAALGVVWLGPAQPFRGHAWKAQPELQKCCGLLEACSPWRRRFWEGGRGLLLPKNPKNGLGGKEEELRQKERGWCFSLPSPHHFLSLSATLCSPAAAAASLTPLSVSLLLAAGLRPLRSAPAACSWEEASREGSEAPGAFAGSDGSSPQALPAAVHSREPSMKPPNYRCCRAVGPGNSHRGWTRCCSFAQLGNPAQYV